MVKRDFCNGDKVKSPEEAEKRLSPGTKVCLLKDHKGGFTVHNKDLFGHLRDRHGSGKVQIVEGQAV